MAYDIIADIHGQDSKLTALLAKLDYRIKDGAYRHPEGRMALFLGDLIDRGPGQVRVVEIVRSMVEAGSARSIMGNHEWNAIGFATPDPDGEGYLRTRTPKKRKLHKEFLEQVGEDSDLHKEVVDWFRTLPPILDLGDLRLCHAWWNSDYAAHIAQNSDPDGSLSEEFLLSSFRKGTDSCRSMEGLTKGLEVDLPDGSSYYDHTGIERKDIRVRWWDETATGYRSGAIIPESERERIPDLPLPESARFVSLGDVPTFVGHYWLTGTPKIQNPTTAILDFGAGLGGPLVAYRWGGEAVLNNKELIWV